MTEVNVKTSQGSVLSGVNQKASGGGFDIRSWQGLTAVLQAARNAKMDDTAYAAFRDMVLSYAQSGGDPALKARIDAAIATFSTPQPKIVEKVEKKEEEAKPKEEIKEPVAVKPVVQSVAAPRMRVGRPTPAFGGGVTPSVSVAPQSVPTPVPVKVVEEIKPAAPIPPPAPEPIQKVEVAPIQEVVPPTSSKSLEEYKARITDIKRIVHSTVGNPVTLIDAGNQIGREYMNSLLTAMKTVGGGPGNIDEAMSRLENAFGAVQTLSKEIIAQKEVAIETPETPVAEEIVEESVAEETPQEVEKETEALNDEPVELEKSEEPLIAPEVLAPEPSPSLYTSMAELRRETAEVEEVKLPPTPRATVEELPEALRDPEPEGVIIEERPVAPKMPSVVVSPSQNIETELNSNEVTAALMQLLHEWNIFASSGMFGTGPGGYDHPLYKELAPLPMLTVANGGWNNAKTEDRQSVRDYVNAWRHEQSISYNPTETFEHYLRRVVHRVLKRQKGGLGA